MRRSLAICRHDLRVMRQDVASLAVMIVMPVVLISFMRPVFKDVIAAAGYEGASGAEHAVPGLTLMFAMFLVSFISFSFFREHQWGTWERLRASPARPIEIMAGKVLPSLGLMLVQMLSLFAIGRLLFGLQVRGSVVGLVVVVFVYALFLVALGVAITSVCKTVNQTNTLINVGAFVLAGVGGAMAPISALPGWIERIAPAVPTYWAMRGLRGVILEGDGLTSVIAPVLVLGAFTAAATALALMRFRFEETKLSWA